MILLPVITLILIFGSYLIKNGKRLDIVHLLIMTYLVMGIASVVLELTGLFPNIFTLEFEPVVYLSVCFIIVFWGFTGFKNQKLSVIRIENSLLYRALEIFLLIGGFLAIIFFLPFAGISLTGDIAYNRADILIMSEILGEFGIVNSFFSLLSNLFILAQACVFLNLIPRNGKRNTKMAYLLLISSFSYVLYVLAYAGRDGVVYWIMSYLFCFLLFRDFVAKDELKRLNRCVALSSAILLIVFAIITMARFSESEVGTGLATVNYAGQQIRNFNDHYIVDAPLQYGKLCFPEVVNLMRIIGFDVGPKIDIEVFDSFFSAQGVQSAVFTTFIGLLMLDFGKLWLLVFLGLLSFITRITLNKVSRTGVFEFSSLVIFILLYQMVYWGVFYFRHYVANFYILFMILLFVFFKACNISRSSILLNKRSITNGR